MLALTPDSAYYARCQETGAYLRQSRKQWTLVYERGDFLATRHWQRAKVPSDDIIQKAQKALDKILRNM